MIASKKEFYALVSLISAIAITLVKAAAAVLTNSLAVWAEAADSAFDIVYTGLGYGAVKLSMKPPDEDHAYGHGKIESLIVYTETIFIFIFSSYIIYESINRIFKVSNLYNLSLGISFMIGAFLADLSLAFLNYMGYKQTSSQVLKINYTNFLGDVVRTIVVIFSLFISQVFSQVFDSLFSIILALYLIKEGYRLLVETTDVLLDRMPKGLGEEIKKIALRIKDVKEVCSVRARSIGDKTYIDLVVRIDSSKDLYEAHEISEIIEKKIKSKFKNADIVVHIEPSVSERSR